MSARRKTNADGQVIGYDVEFVVDDWRIEAILWTNEPRGTPKFVVTGRGRHSPSVPASGRLSITAPPPARPARMERVAKADIDKYARWVKR